MCIILCCTVAYCLDIPIGFLDTTSSCLELRRGYILLHKGCILPHRGCILLHRDRILLHRGCILLHRDQNEILEALEAGSLMLCWGSWLALVAPGWLAGWAKGLMTCQVEGDDLFLKRTSNQANNLPSCFQDS